MSDADVSRLSAGEVKRQLQAMDDEDFEYFVADLWELDGWTTEVSQKSRDKSLDVLAERDSPYHQRHAIQAKRYQEGNRVGGPKISEYASLRDQFDADAAVVVTTSGFTKDARERGDTLNVKLVNGGDLAEMVEQYDAYDLIQKYGTLATGQETSATGEGTVTGTRTAPFGGQQSTASDSYDWNTILTYAGTVWAILAFLLGALDPSTGSALERVLLGTGLLAMAMMEIGLYKCLTEYRERGVWSPNMKWWLIGAAVAPFIVVPYYKLKEQDLPALD